MQAKVELDLSKYVDLKKQQLRLQAECTDDGEFTNHCALAASIQTYVIPFLKNHPEIKSLDLSYNQLSVLDLKAIATVQSLTELELNDCHLGDEEAKVLSTMTNLGSLNLGCNKRLSKEGLAAILTLRLTKLNLSHNQLSVLDLKAIATVQSLTELELNDCHLGDEEAKVLSTMTNLGSLNLSCNYTISEQGLAAILTLRLTKLNLDHIDISDTKAKVFENHPTLMELSVFNCNINDEGASFLATIQKLTMLNLWSNNSISKNNLMAFCNHPNLKGLNVSECFLGDECVKALTTIPNLRWLDMPSCNISDEGAIRLAALPLTRLNLTNNLITNKGLMAFVNHPTLEWLFMNCNYINIGVVQAKALHSNDNLIKLHLVSNPRISKEAKKLLKESNPIRRAQFGRDVGLPSPVPSLMKIGLFALKTYIETGKYSTEKVKEMVETLKSLDNTTFESDLLKLGLEPQIQALFK